MIGQSRFAGLQTRSLGQVHPESVAFPLVSTGLANPACRECPEKRAGRSFSGRPARMPAAGMVSSISRATCLSLRRASSARLPSREVRVKIGPKSISAKCSHCSSAWTGQVRSEGLRLIPTSCEVFEEEPALPDPDDNHVLAAAIATSASVIVTDNLADFPSALLQPHGIDAISADDFIADTIELAPSEAILALRRRRERFNSPVLDVAALIHKAEAQGLLQVATVMDEYQSLP